MGVGQLLGFLLREHVFLKNGNSTFDKISNYFGKRKIYLGNEGG